VTADLGPWAPLSPVEGGQLLVDCGARWWIAGGWAIDLLIGAQTRAHSDLDVLVLRSEQATVRAHLKSWDLHAADPPGALRPWPIGEVLPPAVHDVWCRPEPSAPWAFQLMIDDTDGGQWVFRRDGRIRRSVASLAGPASRPGLPVLAPDIQLLYKSAAPGDTRARRAKDEDDFAHAVPHMSREERQWLREALGAIKPDHGWINGL
jgi:hypothetical protein